jgi:hypothetical protein
VRNKATNIIVFALCVVITLATLVNVFGDNAGVIEKAEKAVCWNVDACELTKTAMVRTPLGQTFTFVGGGRSVQVTCRRAAIIVGEYSCAVDK